VGSLMGNCVLESLVGTQLPGRLHWGATLTNKGPPESPVGEYSMGSNSDFHYHRSEKGKRVKFHWFW